MAPQGITSPNACPISQHHVAPFPFLHPALHSSPPHHLSARRMPNSRKPVCVYIYMCACACARVSSGAALPAGSTRARLDGLSGSGTRARASCLVTSGPRVVKHSGFVRGRGSNGWAPRIAASTRRSGGRGPAARARSRRAPTRSDVQTTVVSRRDRAGPAARQGAVLYCTTMRCAMCAREEGSASVGGPAGRHRVPRALLCPLPPKEGETLHTYIHTCMHAYVPLVL